MSSSNETFSDAKVSCVRSPPLFSKEQEEEGKMENNYNAHLHSGSELESSPEYCDNVENYSCALSAKSTSTSTLLSSSSSPYPHVNPSSSSSININNNLQTSSQEIKCALEEESTTASNETCEENDLVELNRLKRENRFLRLQLLRIQEERQRHCTNFIKNEEEEHNNINDYKKESNELQPCSVAESSAVSTHSNKTTQCDVEETNVGNKEGDGKVSKEECEENNQFIEVPALSNDSSYVIHTREHDRFDSESVNSKSNSCNSNTSLLHSHSSNEMELFCNQEKTNQMELEAHLEECYDNNNISSDNNSKFDMTEVAASTTTVQQNSVHNNELTAGQNVCQEPLQLQKGFTSHEENKKMCCSNNAITRRADSESKMVHQHTHPGDDDYNYNTQVNECIGNINSRNDNNNISMDVCEENEALKLRLQMLQRKSNREKLKRAATERQLRYEIELLRLALNREARNLNYTQQEEQPEQHQEREQLRLSLEDEKGHHNNSCYVNSIPETTSAFHPTPPCESKTHNFSFSAEINKELTQSKPVEVIQHVRKLELEVATHETDNTLKDNNEISATNTSFLLDTSNSRRRRRKSELHNTVYENSTTTTTNDKDEISQHNNERRQMLGNTERNLFASPLNTTQLSLESSELPVAYALHMNCSNRRAERKARLLQVQRQMSEYNKEFLEHEQESSSSPQRLSPPQEASTPIITTVAAAASTNICQCNDINNDINNDNNNDNNDNNNDNNDNEQSKSNNRAVYSSIAFRRQRKQHQQESRCWSQNNYNHTNTIANSSNNGTIIVNPNQIGIEVTDKIKDRSWYLCKVIAYALRHSIQVCKQNHVCSQTSTFTSSTSSTLLGEHAEHNNEVENANSTSQETKGAGSSNDTETVNVDQMPCVMNKISTIALQRAINETVSYEFRCIHNLPHILLTPRHRTTYYDQANYKGNTINNSNNTNDNNSNCMCKAGFNEFCDKCQFHTCDLALEGRIDTLPSPIHSLMSSATSYPNSTSIDNNTIINSNNSNSSNRKALHASHECTSKEWNNVAFEDENDDANLISTFTSSSLPAFGSNYYNNNDNDEDINYNACQNNWRSNNNVEQITSTTTTTTTNNKNIFASSTTLPSSFSQVSVNESGYVVHPRTTSTYSYSCNSSPANRSPRSPFHKSHHRGNYFSNKGELREDVVSVTFHAPVIFAQIRDYLQCNCNELRSAAAFSVWRQSLSPGKSGATLYYFGNYMVKSLRESEFTFLVRKLLPAYAMYCERNPHTFLCHFYALWTVEWVKTNDKQRYVLMHNIFNTKYYIHRIYDVKGSSIGRSGYTNSTKSSPSSPSSTGKTKDVKDKKSTKYNYNSPPSRTAFGALLLKDNDLPSTLIICGAYHRAFLIAQFRSDVHFLLGLDIVDYSCVIGVRSRIFVGNDVHKSEHSSITSLPSSQEKFDKERCSGSNAHEANNLQTCLVHSHADKTNTWDKDTENTLCSTKGKTNNLNVEQSSFAKVNNDNSRDNNECGYVYLHNCDGGLLSLPIYTTADHSAAREDVYYIGLIDLLQYYNSAKKIESFAKGLINDRNAISVIPPKEYGERLIKVLERITV